MAINVIGIVNSIKHV